MHHIVESDRDDPDQSSLTCIAYDVQGVATSCDDSEENSDKSARSHLYKRNQLIGKGCAVLHRITEQDKSRDPVQKGLVDEKDER